MRDGVIMKDFYIDGYVEILQDNKTILPYTHNKFTDNGMRGLLSIIATSI